MIPVAAPATNGHDRFHIHEAYSTKGERRLPFVVGRRRCFLISSVSAPAHYGALISSTALRKSDSENTLVDFSPQSSVKRNRASVPSSMASTS